jgi:hypothetical protein
MGIDSRVLSRRFSPRHRPAVRGFTIVAAAAVLTVVGVMALAFLGSLLSSARQTEHHADAMRLQSAGESALLAGVHALWSGYLNANGGTPGNLTSFRTHLDGLGFTPGEHDLRALADLPQGGSVAHGIAGANVESLTLERADTAGTTELAFGVGVSSRRGDGLVQRPMQRSFRSVYVVGGGPWQGLNYALLANNVNCIMCHARIDSAARFHNSDPSKHGTFERVRVGTLERLLLRSSIDSTLAGTLYVRGAATHKDGTPITDWSAETLKAFAFDAQGKLLQDGWGDPTLVDLEPAGPAPHGNLYLNYALDRTAMVDGYLPESFPAPFPDDGGGSGAGAGNRVVDAAEFAAATAGFTGSLSGGSIHLAGPGAIDTASELASALSTGNRPSLGPATTGSVVLTGTLERPIVLNGDVAIDGDLVLQGTVIGEGTLMVSGNVYIPSDLVYKDGTDANGDRTFGIASDGTSNTLALAAGGSILVGNMFYSKSSGTVTGKPTGAYNFVLSEMALFNRGEWMKTQPLLPGSGQRIDAPSTWTVPNPGYVAGYVPRYYNFTTGGPIPIFNRSGYFDGTSWVGKEHGSSWDTTNSYAYPDRERDPYLFHADGTPKAVVQSLTAKGGWMSDAMLSKLMKDASANHPRNTPLRIDALLYTNNSIYGIVGASTPMKGQMVVNGAILAADVGLLVPGSGEVGLVLNYDPRGKPLLEIESDEGVTLRRVLFSVTGVP